MKKTNSFLSVFISLLILTSVFSTTTVSAGAVERNSDAIGAVSDEPVGTMSSVRQRLVNYMTAMATVKWTCSGNFTTYYPDRYYNGSTYYGIPYDQEWGTNGLITLEMFNKMISGGKTIGNRIGRSDCSSTVCVTYRQIDSSIDYNKSTTLHLYPGNNNFIKVGSYSYQTNKATTCKNNGKNVMVAAYKQLQPGDCVCSDGHAMLVVGNNGKDAITVTHQNSYPYKYDPNTKTSTFINDNDRKYPRNSSWEVNGSWSYSDLFTKCYIPLTNKILALSDVNNAVDLGTGFYASILVTSNTNLAVAANSSANVLLATKANSNAQKWLFERDTDKSYRITNVSTKKCLDVSGAKTSDGTNIGVYAGNNKANQRWYFVKDGSGYTLVPKSCTSSAMDIKDGTISAGSNIWQYTRNQTNAQRFSVVKDKYTIAYNANGGSGSMAPTTVESGGKVTLSACGFTRSGYTFGGYNVYRSSDQTWYAAGVNKWLSSSAIKSGGYAKYHYNAGSTYTLGTAWTAGAANGCIYTFYPIWLPNNPELIFYNNYSECNYMRGSNLGEDFGDYFLKRDAGSPYMLSVDKTETLNNKNSLKIVSSAAGASGKDMVFCTSTNHGRSVEPEAGAFTFAGDNKNMTLSFWAKASESGTTMYIRWGYEGAYKSVKLTTDWQFYSVPMNKNIYTGKNMHPYFDRAGTVWLNNITLVDGATAAENNFRSETESVPYGQRYAHGGKYTSLPQPEREGYTFLGWFTQASGGTQITNDTNVSDYHTTVYAHWKKDVSNKPVAIAETAGKRYELYDNSMTWEDAKAFCESKGGHPVTITDEEENRRVASLLADRNCTAWLGAKLNTGTNQWEWITGEAFEYTKWAPGEPSGGSSPYAHMLSFDTGLKQTAGRWNDTGNLTSPSTLYSIENCMVVCEYDFEVGDTNGDGKLNIRDVTAIQRHISELESISGSALFAADTNGDGVVDINDATHLQMYFAEFDGIVLGKQN